MRIAVVNETSACDKNAQLVAALEDRGHDIINAGMKEKGAKPELTYIHTAFLSALLLHSGKADFIVGGCGTGQGYLNAVMQYPGVFCGLISSPLDGWLYTRINGGNCLSLPLNQGYGWAGDVNLRFLFDRLFSVESGCGYPDHRKESQKESREILTQLSCSAHLSFPEIIRRMPETVFFPVVNYPGVADMLDFNGPGREEWKYALNERLAGDE